MGIFSNFLKENKKEQKPLITIDKELSKLAVDLVGVSEGTALIPLKSNDMSGEYARLCGLGLGNSANAKFLKDRIRDIDAYNRNIIKACELLAYIKTINEFLGDSVVLVSKDSFYKLCHKYILSVGSLEQFTGVIPDANLKEFSDIKYKMNHYSGYVKLNTNHHTIEIKRIYNRSDKSDSSISKYFDYSFNIISYPAYLYRMSDIKEFKDKEWAEKVSLDVRYVNRDEIFIAYPKSNLQEKKVIVSHPVDPIIFQYCPYGVLIYTMWGKEAEDKVFEEYKKLRAIK